VLPVPPLWRQDGRSAAAVQDNLGNVDLAALVAEWAPTKDLKARFGFSDDITRRLIAKDLIVARKVGPRTLVNLASVRRFLEDQPLPSLTAEERAARLPGCQTATTA
jgi:hypothetical protein